MRTLKRRLSRYSGLLYLLFAGGTLAAGQSLEAVAIDGGSAGFEAGTNVPGIEIKGSSSQLSGRAAVSRAASGLTIGEVHVSLPAKSLATGMKVRDEHMQKYIFTTPDGQMPDIEFTAGETNCPAAGGAGEFTCPVSGTLTIRGPAHSFAMNLSVKEPAPGSFRVSGDGVVKLSDYGIPLPKQFGVTAANNVKVHLAFAGRPAPAETAAGGGAR